MCIFGKALEMVIINAILGKRKYEKFENTFISSNFGLKE